MVPLIVQILGTGILRSLKIKAESILKACLDAFQTCHGVCGTCNVQFVNGTLVGRAACCWSLGAQKVQESSRSIQVQVRFLVQRKMYNLVLHGPYNL